MSNIENTIDRIQELLEDTETEQQLREELNSYHEADLADIFQLLKPEERLACFLKLDEEKAADVIEYLPPQLQVEILGDIEIPTGIFKTPLDYGAVGDGVADDTHAFTELFENETVIFIPKGIYNVHNLEIPSNVYVLGESREGVIFTTDKESGCILKTKDFDNLTNSGQNLGMKNTILCNFTIDGNKNVNGFNCYGTRNNISNISIKNCKTGFYSEWCKYLGLENGYGTESYIKEVYISNCELGIDFTGAHDTMFSKIFVAMCENGIHIHNTETSIADGSNFSQCHIYTNKGYGILCESACIFDNVESESNGYYFIDGEQFENETPQYGIKITGHSNLSACRFHHNYGDGISVSGDGNKIDCHLWNNTNYGLTFDRPISNNFIRCFATDSEGMGNAQHINLANCSVEYKNFDVHFNTSKAVSSGFIIKSDVYSFTNDSFAKQFVIVEDYNSTVYYAPQTGVESAFTDCKTFILNPGDKLTTENPATFKILHI